MVGVVVVANLLAIGAALQWAGRADGWSVRDEGLQSGHPPFRLYASTQVHSSVVKAARLLGLGEQALGLVPVTSSFQVDTTALASLIEQDRRAGLRPFCVIASLGTTSTGALDPLAEIAALCRHNSRLSSSTLKPLRLRGATCRSSGLA